MEKTILIAEDYEDSRCCLKFMLEYFGFRVVEAKDGAEAVDEFKKQQPDLVLMDLAMPRMDGLTATKEIRNSEFSGKTPIIAVSAFGKALYNEAIQSGCDDFLNKPLDFDSLVPVLKKYLTH
jgi:two-component system chemotaxis response regulator CheY